MGPKRILKLGFNALLSYTPIFNYVTVRVIWKIKICYG